eukprot:3886180-Rhodomonas_salina.1
MGMIREYQSGKRCGIARQQCLSARNSAGSGRNRTGEKLDARHRDRDRDRQTETGRQPAREGPQEERGRKGEQGRKKEKER